MSKTPNGSKKRAYIIMALLIGLFVFMYWIFTETQPQVITKEELNKTNTRLNETQAIINVTSKQVNATVEAIVNVTENQELGFENQKKLAKGLNELGNIVIGDVKDIKEATNLIDDIKFNTEEILNKSDPRNITFSNMSTLN